MVILLRKRDLILSGLCCCLFLGMAAVLWKETPSRPFKPESRLLSPW